MFVHWEIEAIQETLMELKNDSHAVIWLDCKTENLESVRDWFALMGFKIGPDVPNGKHGSHPVSSLKIQHFNQFDPMPEFSIFQND